MRSVTIDTKNSVSFRLAKVGKESVVDKICAKVDFNNN